MLMWVFMEKAINLVIPITVLNYNLKFLNLENLQPRFALGYFKRSVIATKIKFS